MLYYPNLSNTKFNDQKINLTCFNAFSVFFKQRLRANLLAAKRFCLESQALTDMEKSGNFHSF